MPNPLSKKMMTTGVVGKASRTITMPRYMLTSAGTVAEGFENSAEWAPSAGSVANNSTAGQFSQGSQSVKFTAASAQQQTYKYPFGPVSIAGLERVYLDVFHHDAFKHVTVRMYDNHARTIQVDAQTTINLSTANPVGSMVRTYCSKRQMVDGGQGFATPIVDIRITYEATAVTSISVDNLVLNAVGFGAGVILCFDDGYESVVTKALPLLAPHNVRASVGVISSAVGQVNALTWAELAQLKSAGWCMCNHGETNASMLGQDLATQTAHLQACIDALTAHDLSAGALYLLYPYADYDANTLQAAVNLGMKLGRKAGSSAASVVQYLPHSDLRFLDSLTVSNATTVQNAKDYLDRAITDKAVAVYHMHDIDGATDWTSTQLTQFVDYIVAKSRAGVVYPITFDDYYKLHQGSVKIPTVT